MRVDQAFNRAGFEIVSANKVAGSLVFDVRVPMRGLIPARWKTFMSTILPTAEQVGKNPTPKWGLEISKRFFSQKDVVRYLWRVVMTGNLAACQALVVTATLDSLRTGVEVSEVPLVGQTNMLPDPTKGRFKGAYPKTEGDDAAARAVASAFSVG